MRFFSLLTALLVSVSLYVLVFERPALLAFASGEEATAEDAPVPEAEPATSVAVVAMSSTAAPVEQVVLVRGRTEAARQVDVRAETSGQVISDPLRKGAFVQAGDLLCEIDPGTREVALAEAAARLLEARARLPETEARVAEAEARLAEAEINDNASRKLSEGGFASETRVAATGAAVESARAGVQAAKSGVEGARSGVQSAEAAVAVARKEIARLRIAAPFAGLLETDAAELGSLLQPGGLCATIVQLDPIKLVGFVPETEVDKVTVGAKAGARLATGREVTGRVTFLSRSADPQTRTFRVEVQVPNGDLSIRDGQTVEIGIEAAGRPAHLVPQSALTLDDEGILGVRTVEDGNRAGFVPVTVLRDTTRGVYVTGLADQADIIVVGQEFVTYGVPVDPTFREAVQ